MTPLRYLSLLFVGLLAGLMYGIGTENLALGAFVSMTLQIVIGIADEFLESKKA